MIADEQIGYFFKENQDLNRFGNRIIYNSYHQRSDQLKKDPQYRILMLGDSVTNGGVLTDQSETITEFLEEKIDNFYNVKGEVLNASAGSWAIENEYEYIKRFGFFDSDIVILQINTDDFFQPKSTNNKVGTINLPNKNPPSAIYELLNRYVIHKYILSPENKNNSSYEAILNPDSQFKENLDFLLQIIKLADERNKKLIVLLTPYKNELDNKVYEDERKEIIDILEENHIPYVNLLNQELDLRKTHFRDRIHFNEKGNKTIANAIFELIINNNLLTIANN
ncbi:MAG: hypothetical protein DHS20C13_06610 [Thermodesulfobacteriota bacterium]|nr:MAG: hypothetical protein DHS20C13_06610 [Thermodesulfobacteriota bacterium]